MLPLSCISLCPVKTNFTTFVTKSNKYIEQEKINTNKSQYIYKKKSEKSAEAQKQNFFPTMSNPDKKKNFFNYAMGIICIPEPDWLWYSMMQ